MTRLLHLPFSSLVLLQLATPCSGQRIPIPLSAPNAWITFTIRNMSLRSINQMICFQKPGQPTYSPGSHPYQFRALSAQTFTYPVGTKVKCVERVDLQGRPQTVYLLAVLTMRDQGRTFKLSL